MAIIRLLKSPALQQAWEEQSSTGFRGTESNSARITAPRAGALSCEAHREQAQRLPPPRELAAWGAGTRPQHGAEAGWGGQACKSLSSALNHHSSLRPGLPASILSCWGISRQRAPSKMQTWSSHFPAQNISLLPIAFRLNCLTQNHSPSPPSSAYLLYICCVTPSYAETQSHKCFNC